MGPLVPDIISQNMNFIVALIIGVFFGAILEQAGFSTSKKLVGLFYGYDFTVLRVFFTAGIVAMVGVMGLNYFGLLDISLVYINPTFLWSAIIGGVVMGLGFVIGGFCPGTSVCAAAIGKIDAMIFIGGAIIGVFIFAEGYPVFEGLYKASNYGNPRLFETLGISQNLFAFLMVVMALVAFWGVSIVENRVNGIKKASIRFTPNYINIALIGVLMLLSAFVFTDRKETLKNKINDLNYTNSYNIDTMSVDEFALCLMNINQCEKLQVIDFRSPEDAKNLSLPKSTGFTLDNLFENEPNKVLRIRNRTNLFVANDELTEKKAAIIASELGYKRIKILKGGMNDFNQNILKYVPINEPKTQEEIYTNRFRMRAALEIPEILKQFKKVGPVEKKQKRVVGGC